MRSIRIAFMGDLALPEMPQKVDIKANSGYLYDFAVCNLEAACRSGTLIRKLANVYSSPEALRTMFEKLGIRYVNLANNHAMDFGEEGLGRLQATLDGIGVQYFGAGGTSSEAMKPVLVSLDGIRFGFIGFSWKPIESLGATSFRAGVALIPPENRLCEAVADLCKVCDHLVVSFHWGYEYERYPLPLHRKIAHAVVDAGASVVVGHHPHVYQGVEFYQGVPIYYSLGNLIMAIPQKTEADMGIVPVLEFTSNSVRPATVLHSVYDRAQDALLLSVRARIEPTIDRLSMPLSLEDRDYERYFRSHRVRRRGLPVFTGTRLDVIRYVWLDIRSFVVRTLVRFGLR